MDAALPTEKSSSPIAGIARLVPASFFGMVLGLVGLGNAWRAAHNVWGLPLVVGEGLMLAGALVWAVLFVLFVIKWVLAVEHALAEARHPVQCCFIGLVGVSTTLVAVGVEPYARPLAIVLAVVGTAFTFGFAVWRTGGLWKGGREQTATTPVLYLPTVAGSYVTAIACAQLGIPDWGKLAFGAGLFSWLAIESVLVHRLYTSPEMPPALRPTLGIQLAPATVGASAYVSLTAGPPDMVAYALIGYGLLQLLVLLRLAPWIFANGVAVTAWGFTFGLTALATAMVKLVGRSDTGPMAVLAPYVFTFVTATLAALILWTLWLLVTGRILPAAPAPVTAAGPGAGAN